MKKIILALLFSTFSLVANAQETPSSEQKNDITADPVLLIAVPAINVSYERLLNADSGIGVNALIGLGEELESFTQFSPFYRFYFGKKFASGFFVEAFVPITSTTEYVDYETYMNGVYSWETKEEKATTVGFGVGLGGKWIVKRNIVLEASWGIARRLKSDDSYIEPITGKVMLGIGYRF